MPQKPKPTAMIDKKAFKKSNQELKARQEAEEAITPKNNYLKCPSYLSDLAKKEWRRLIKLYMTLELKILNDLDLYALASYCEAASLWRSAQAVWKEIGTLSPADEDDKLRVMEARTVMNQQAKIMSDLSSKLCITPMERARMGVLALNQKKKSDGLAKLLSDEDDE